MKLSDLVKDLENDMPYLKCAFQGFAGTGKTHTATLLAIGLYKKDKSRKTPLSFTIPSKPVKPWCPCFKKNKIKAQNTKSQIISYP